MICTKCKNDGVQSEALGKTFYYCRSCKIEIMPESAKKDAGSGHAHAWSGVLDACVRCGTTSTEYMAYPTACRGQPDKAVPVGGGQTYPPAPPSSATSPNPPSQIQWNPPIGTGIGGIGSQAAGGAVGGGMGGGFANSQPMPIAPTPIRRYMAAKHYYPLPLSWKPTFNQFATWMNDFYSTYGRHPNKLTLSYLWEADILKMVTQSSGGMPGVSAGPLGMTIFGTRVCFDLSAKPDRIEFML